MRARRLALVAAPAALVVGVAVAASASLASPTAPTVRATLTRRGPAIRGPVSWRPGAVLIEVGSRVDDQELVLLHFRPGYTYADFLADGRLAHRRGAAARAAQARVFAHTVFDGGVDLFRGQSAGFTVSVRPGTYFLGELTTRPQLERIQVSGAPGAAAAPTAATLTATDGSYRISGPLRAHGTITIANTSTRRHRLNLIPVKPGTTRAQVVGYLRATGGADNAPPPSFALDGPQIGTADLSPRRRMQLAYRLPAGTYAAIDLDQDPGTGRPDALEGFATVVRLR